MIPHLKDFDLTVQAYEKEIKRLEKKLAALVVDHSYNFDELKLNTVTTQQDVGRLKALRDVLHK